MSVIVAQYIGDVKCEFSEDRKNIKKIMIGDEKILWGIWSIFTQLLYKNKDMKCILEKWRPNENKWKFWKSGDWIPVAKYVGRITHEILDEYIKKIFIGHTPVLLNDLSIFRQCDGEIVCLSIGEDSYLWGK